MIYKYSDFYPFMVNDLPGCPTIIKLQALRQAFREFAMRTESWTETLAKVNLVANKTTYTLNPTYDALIKRIVSVEISGSAQDRSHYELINERQLFWNTNYVPKTSITNGLQVKVALYPDVESKTVDPNYFTRWFEGILAKAMYELQIQPRTKWHNPTLAAKNLSEYRDRFTAAKRSIILKKKSGSVQVNLTGLAGKNGSFA